MTQTAAAQSGLIRLVIVEDQRHYRVGLKMDLERFPSEVKIVGEAVTADEAIQIVEHTEPNLVLMDLQLPKSSYAPFNDPKNEYGLGLIEQIGDWTADGGHDTRILVLTVTKDEPYVLYSVLRAGAHGYITKQRDLAGMALISTLRSAIKGKFLPEPGIAEMMAQLGLHQMENSRSQNGLTSREKQVLELLIEGRTDKDIQEILEIEPGTVSTHVGKILFKLQLLDRYGRRQERPSW